MKKLLTAVVAMALILGLSCTAFAAGSASEVAELVSAKDANGNDVEVTATESSVKLELPEASELSGEEEASLEILWQKDLTAATTPVTLTFTVAGTTAEQTLYVFHYVDDAWKIEGQGACPTVSVTVDEMSPFALVVYTPKGSAVDNSSSGKSSATGESDAIPFVMAAVVAAVAGAVVVGSKKRA